MANQKSFPFDEVTFFTSVCMVTWEGTTTPVTITPGIHCDNLNFPIYKVFSGGVTSFLKICLLITGHRNATNLHVHHLIIKITEKKELITIIQTKENLNLKVEV